jgi:hypothetical protein
VASGHEQIPGLNISINADHWTETPQTSSTYLENNSKLLCKPNIQHCFSGSILKSHFLQLLYI